MNMFMGVPAIGMCSQHKNGVHYEIHKHRPNFVKKHSITGRIYPITQIEPMNMKKRHDEIAKTLKHHNSPYELPDLSYLPEDERNARMDPKWSIEELKRRCPECRKLMEKLGM